MPLPPPKAFYNRALFDQITRGLNALRSRDLLIQGNSTMVTAPDGPFIAAVIIALDTANMLTQANLDAIIEDQYPTMKLSRLGRVIFKLSVILTPANFDVIKRDLPLWEACPSNFTIFTQANFDAIQTHQDPLNMFKVLGELDYIGILTQANFDAVMRHPDPETVAKILYDLRGRGEWISNPGTPTRQANFDRIITHKYPEVVAKVMSYLCRANGVYCVYIQENLDAITTHPDLWSVVKAFSILPDVILDGDISNVVANAIIKTYRPNRYGYWYQQQDITHFIQES